MKRLILCIFPELKYQEFWIIRNRDDGCDVLSLFIGLWTLLEGQNFVAFASYDQLVHPGNYYRNLIFYDEDFAFHRLFFIAIWSFSFEEFFL